MNLHFYISWGRGEPWNTSKFVVLKLKISFYFPCFYNLADIGSCKLFYHQTHHQVEANSKMFFLCVEIFLEICVVSRVKYIL